jgi:hypothetical protein
MNKGYAGGDERFVPGIDVVHLNRKRNARTIRDLPAIERKIVKSASSRIAAVFRSGISNSTSKPK